jgi:gamma-glutamylaminecyclotransferase
MAPLQIRPARPDDADAIAALILPIQQQEFGIPITRQAQPDLADIQGFYQQGDGNFWVAEVGGAIVGSIGLRDIGGGQAALRKMFVAAAFRGAAHGVAQALLDTLAQWAAARGVRELWLGTTAQFLAAHRFYEKNGFAQVDRAALPPAFPVMAVDSRFYRLHVAGAALVFVYGTLKQGFPNFARNSGRRLAGAYRTQQPYPLYVVQLPNEDRAPWLVDLPGQGNRVVGEVFAVDAALLAAMDAFEEVGLPGGYVRAEIAVEAADAVDAPAAALRVQAYLKPLAQLAPGDRREGPFAEYTAALAAGYRIELK